MWELAAEKLGQVLHLDLVDLIKVEPGAAAWDYERAARVSFHLLLQALPLLPNQINFFIYHSHPHLLLSLSSDILLIICSVLADDWWVDDLEGVLAFFGALGVQVVLLVLVVVGGALAVVVVK